jgi:hypothetical protein
VIRLVASHVVLGLVGSVILVGLLGGYVAQNIRDEIAKKGRS